VAAVLEFFTTNWILPNYNANSMVLIPETQNVDAVELYRPIAMANFKFKIVSKIIADRLSSIMSSIISCEQRGFIHGRQIRDCICLTSEGINLLHKKTFGGNLALKIDISKAFDTLDWNFLIKFLKTFGFCDKFCNWIKPSFIQQNSQLLLMVRVMVTFLAKGVSDKETHYLPSFFA